MAGIRRNASIGGLAASMVAGLTLFAGPAVASGPVGGGGASGAGEQRFEVRIENVSDGFAHSASGVFTNPKGASAPGPVFPGESYEFQVRGNPGDNLSLATMLIQSNDWFFSPLEAGIPLYDAAGNPMRGDITEYFRVIDPGTEVDEPLSVGPNQAPRQSGPNTGPADPNSAVRVVTSTPPVSDLIKVTVKPGWSGRFTVRITNVSGDSAVPGPISPGAYVVHRDPAPLFTLGSVDRNEGLEAIAEDGSPGDLAAVLASRTGLTTPISPGAYVATAEGNQLFNLGRPDLGRGIEEIAEDGDPTKLSSYLATNVDGESGAFAVPQGASAPAPVFPGGAYTFELSAAPGDRLHLATMFIQSNDRFIGANRWGLDLFRGGAPTSGNVTDSFRLYDAGTEINQFPGFGPDQAPRQAGPDTGKADANTAVRIIERNVKPYVKVTVTPIG